MRTTLSSLNRRRAPLLRRARPLPRIPVLTYHAAHEHGRVDRGNDPYALESDLAMFAKLGVHWRSPSELNAIVAPRSS